jgi:hypothetical protein
MVTDLNQEVSLFENRRNWNETNLVWFAASRASEAASLLLSVTIFGLAVSSFLSRSTCVDGKKRLTPCRSKMAGDGGRGAISFSVRQQSAWSEGASREDEPKLCMLA